MITIRGDAKSSNYAGGDIAIDIVQLYTRRLGEHGRHGKLFLCLIECIFRGVCEKKSIYFRRATIEAGNKIN